MIYKGSVPHCYDCGGSPKEANYQIMEIVRKDVTIHTVNANMCVCEIMTLSLLHCVIQTVPFIDVNRFGYLRTL